MAKSKATIPQARIEEAGRALAVMPVLTRKEASLCDSERPVGWTRLGRDLHCTAAIAFGFLEQQGFSRQEATAGITWHLQHRRLQVLEPAGPSVGLLPVEMLTGLETTLTWWPWVQGEDLGQWSEAASHRTWERRLGKSRSTLQRDRKRGFRMRRTPSGDWEIHRAESGYREWERSGQD